jgi:hypothetical protein
MKRLAVVAAFLALLASLVPAQKLGGSLQVGGSATVSSTTAGGGGGPTASDDFNRADNPSSLGSNWTIQVTAFGAQVIGNQAAGVDGDAYVFWSGAGTFTDNQYSEVTISTFVAGLAGRAGVRQSGAGVGITNVTGYFCGADRSDGPTDDRYKIMRYVAGTATQLAAAAAGTVVTSGDVIKLEVTESSGTNTLTCSRNGTPVTNLIGITDSGIGSGGKPGFSIGATTARADDWSAGTP